eukprot:10746404-Heterocapsa_arctica.AAC.1
MVSGVANRHCDYNLDEQYKSRSRTSHIGPLCAGASMNEETTHIGKALGTTRKRAVPISIREFLITGTTGFVVTLKRRVSGWLALSLCRPWTLIIFYITEYFINFGGNTSIGLNDYRMVIIP